MSVQWSPAEVVDAANRDPDAQWQAAAAVPLRRAPGTEVKGAWHRAWRWIPVFFRALFGFASIDYGTPSDAAESTDVPKGFAATAAGRFLGIDASGAAPARWLVTDGSRMALVQADDQAIARLRWNEHAAAPRLVEVPGKGYLRAEFPDSSSVGLAVHPEERRLLVSHG
jgi:hypothetical protein